MCSSDLVKDAWAVHLTNNGKLPAFILLQNHGIFVAADSVAGVDEIYRRVTESIRTRIRAEADFSPIALDTEVAATSVKAAGILSGLAAVNGKPARVQFAVDVELAKICASSESFAAVASPFSPDHIVYAGSDFLYFDEPLSKLDLAFNHFVKYHDRKPKLVAIRDLGVFGLGDNDKSAGLAVDLFRDAVKVAKIGIAHV